MTFFIKYQALLTYGLNVFTINLQINVAHFIPIEFTPAKKEKVNKVKENIVVSMLTKR